MKLVDMKIAPGTKDPADMPAPAPADAPQYPWGLQLHLGKDELEKLGIDTDEDAEVEAQVSIVAKGVVTGYSVNKRQGGEESRCLDIQITSLGVEPQAEKKSASQSLYPSKDTDNDGD